jgi:hypothetical protein
LLARIIVTSFVLLQDATPDELKALRSVSIS